MGQYLLQTLVTSPRLVRAADGAECLRFSKQLALLIYLAARPGGGASREELLGLFWYGSSPADARRALRQVLFQMRHRTEPDLLLGDRELTLRQDRIRFDVQDFRDLTAAGRIEEALAVYRADFLAAVGLPGAREFEEWAYGLRRLLATERRQLLRSRIEHHADLGAWANAARLAEQLVEASPNDLQPRIRLVELLTLAGDGARASVAAQEARQVAAGEVGAVPAAVEEAIARALAGGETGERRFADAFPHNPELIGRAAEFGAVVEAWKAAREGRGGGAILFLGEAGIGKTRLTQELEHRFAHDRGVVLRAACHLIERSDPLGPFLDLLHEAARAPGLAGANPASLEILAALVPEVASTYLT